MKNMQKLLLVMITVTHLLHGHGELIIRLAQPGDLDAISCLSSHEYQTHFKSLWEKSYAPLFPMEQSIDDFVAEKIVNQKEINKSIIAQQQQESEGKIFVAYLVEERATPLLAGYCRVTKQDAQTLYINYILVDEQFRKQGIAKKLVGQAISSFDAITECKFRALAQDTFINDLYEKHGCIKKGTVALDINTGKIATDPSAPITHVDYCFTVVK